MPDSSPDEVSPALHSGDLIEEPDPSAETVGGQETVSDASGAETSEPLWSFGRRLALRFAALYAVLYTFPFPLNRIPGTQTWWGWHRDLEWALIDLLAVHVFGIVDPLDRPYGSGDPTHSYVRLVLHLVLAAVGALLWLLLERSVLAKWRARDRKLAAWLHIGVRYYLALTLLNYGFAKVFPNQFPSPWLTRLLAPFGDSSPMNVLWTFMGASPAYVIFAGLSEVLGGLLLLWRRTATLGALVAVGVMTNVVAVNYMYDVPVKLYSSHLLLFAIALTLPDLGRLLRVLLLNRPTAKRDLSYPSIPRWLYVVKALVIAYLLFTVVVSHHSQFNQMRQRPALWGIWDVETFRLDGREIPPLRTDPIRWQNLVVELPTFGVVRGMDDTRWRAQLQYDEQAETLQLRSNSNWTYEYLPDDTLILRGEYQRTTRNTPWAGAGADNPETPREPQVEITLRRRSESELVSALSSREVLSGEGPSKEVPSDETASEEPASGEENAKDEKAELEKPEATVPEVTVPETMVPQEVRGHWTVTDFRVIGDTFTPRHRAAPFGWDHIHLQADRATVEYEEGLTETYDVSFETIGPRSDILRLRLTSTAQFQLTRPSEDQLTLTGERAGHRLEIDLQRRDLDEFLVRRRGFNWINEIPLNRY